MPLVSVSVYASRARIYLLVAGGPAAGDGAGRVDVVEAERLGAVRVVLPGAIQVLYNFTYIEYMSYTYISSDWGSSESSCLAQYKYNYR